MKLYDPLAVAGQAVSNTPDRPAAALAHDHDDGRLVVFRIEPGQQVPVHTSPSSVFLTVVSGRGFFTGGHGDHEAAAGAIAAYEPGEPHGMRAGAERFIVAALITPRPGTRRQDGPAR